MSIGATVSPVIGGTRMLVAPVDPASGVPLVFDPAAQGRFRAGAVPEGWFDPGTVSGVERDIESKWQEVWSGAPAMVRTRAQSRVSARLRCTFSGWSRLAMALSGGSGCMNLLRVAGNATHADSGGSTQQAITVLPGSTAATLQLPVGTAVQVGDVVVVDEDYTGQTGYVGAGIAAAFVGSAESVGGSADYLRRVSWNVGIVADVQMGSAGLQAILAAPLPAGVPLYTMKFSRVDGFLDRVGGIFQREWSALLVSDGVQGDRVIVHYPRLQSIPLAETSAELAAGLRRVRLQAELHALPVIDSSDGAAVLCYRSYLPAPGRLP